MKLLVISTGYPSKDNMYDNNFLQKRLELYKEQEPNFEIEVIIFSKNESNIKEYIYNGILVKKMNLESLKKEIKKYNPKIILIHFFSRYLYEEVILKTNQPKIIWVHGVEALSWRRRLFNLKTKKIRFFKYVIENELQLKKLKKLINYSNKSKKIKFIFISNWMKDICYKDTKAFSENYTIIPNIIDTNFFDYKEKNLNHKKNILLIRNFNSKKYATDIAIKAIKYLKKHYNRFGELNFTIVGKGTLWEKQVKDIKDFSNVKLINKFLSHEEIKDLHLKNGVFLCPTRQDAQGVSMCEAMSSGLVPITSNNTAIPEFVDSNSGYLTNNYKEIAESIIEMNENYDLFKEKSYNASISIEKKCGMNKTILKEIELIKDMIKEQI
jgi:glycosyltransferase involved in cell wall biosynthesis